ncbi:MAG: YihY/virulence factor BrkB family protein [Mycobacteriales bacterium]
MVKPGELFSRARARSPLLDHLVRTRQRYQADGGDRLASAVTFYWFLSLFPILLIAVYVTRQALGDDAGRQITDSLGPYLGAPTAKAIAKVVQDNAGKAGVIGLAGTLFSGLGWLAALRGAIRTVWHQNVTAGNFLLSKVADVVALVGLFGVIAASVVVSGAETAATKNVLHLLELSDTTAARIVTGVLSYTLGALIDVGIFVFLFLRLAKVSSPVRQLLKGAVFGAVGFEVLKFFGAFYIGRTTSKGEATYGTFATVVGLLLFLNLVWRLVLYTAAFTVTAPHDDDVRPSGTADRAIARRAGVPEQYVGDKLSDDGAPTPLGAALREDPGVQRSWSPKHVPEESPAAAEEVPGPLPGEKQVVLAARAVTVASAAVVAGVGLYVVKTVSRVLRR